MIHNLLLISLGLLVVAVPALQEYRDLMDCEFFSPRPCFENTHSLDMASSPTHNFAGLALSTSLLMFFVTPAFSEEVFLPSYSFPLSSNEPLALRC